MPDNKDPTRTHSQSIEDELVPIRARLDQLCKKAADEGIHVERATTEALLGELAAVQALEARAIATRNTRLIATVRIEHNRCREALGFVPRRGRRR